MNGGGINKISEGRLFSGSGWIYKVIRSICGYVEYEGTLRNQSRDVS